MNILQQDFTGLNPILAPEAHGETSAKYKYQNTEHLIQRLEKMNFEVSGISYGIPRKKDRQGFQKHLVVLQHNEFRIDDDNHFQLLLTNDHSGKSSLKLDLGIYRTVCANGIVVGNDFFNVRIPHVGGHFYDRIDEGIGLLWDKLPEITTNVKRLQLTDTEDFQRKLFAHSVVEELLKGKDVYSIDPRSLYPKRRGDLGQDAYTIFNRMQEVALKGGLRYSSFKHDEHGQRISVGDQHMLINNSTRAVKSIDRQLELNKFVWDKAQEFLLVA